MKFFLEIIDDNYSEEVLEEMINMLDYENLGRVSKEEFSKLAGGKDIHPIGLSFPPVLDLFELMDKEDQEIEAANEKNIKNIESLFVSNNTKMSSLTKDGKSPNLRGLRSFKNATSSATPTPLDSPEKTSNKAGMQKYVPEKTIQSLTKSMPFKSFNTRVDVESENVLNTKMFDYEDHDGEDGDNDDDEEDGSRFKRKDSDGSMGLPLRRMKFRLSAIPIPNMVSGTISNRKHRDLLVLSIIQENRFTVNSY